MLFYRLLIMIASPVILGHILWKSTSNHDSRYFWQRLGFQYSSLPENCLWFHCASVGEVNTLLPLLKNLHAKKPQLKFLITTNTVTGGKIVSQQKLDYLFHSYLPFDWVFCIRRFIKTAKPEALYVLETEIWPNLFRWCFNRGIAIHIINARLSSKTSTAKPWVKSLLKTALSNVSSISARTEHDARGYALLGADKTRIATLGNLKFTTALSTSQSMEDKSFSSSRDFVLVASTHDDEELQIYKLWKTLNRQELLVIAPRHPERAASIVKNLNCGTIAIRSRNQPISSETSVYLLDTVGELKNYFKNAKLVVMGGSFTPIGGHNILEPASYNNAIITGPHMENFTQELALMLEKQAIIQVASYDELAVQMGRLLDDADAREELQQNTARLTHNVEEILQGYTSLILGET
ncbi:MAG: 3-deoxy-D-manno-octulosonic acid transferase [Gammaproteobacteria bacterium]|nr:3-deoxy-D-manno-octulosonic acid transferase [Gammaproteobacteria bacterium]